MPTYTVDEVSLVFPIPAEASEILDFTGQHNYERFPQRGPLRAGIHLRENRRGRTAADSAYVLHAGVPGFGFAEGRVWAVHTAWSGNHRHYAERVYTGEQVLGGGEVLLPGEIVLAQRRDVRDARGSTARTATGSTRSRTDSTIICARSAPIAPRSDR